MIRHPNYSVITKRNDIALLRLLYRIPFTDDVYPACLQINLNDEGPDVPVIVTGWGSILAESQFIHFFFYVK